MEEALAECANHTNARRHFPALCATTNKGIERFCYFLLLTIHKCELWDIDPYARCEIINICLLRVWS
jgi:hypothetical protein